MAWRRARCGCARPRRALTLSPHPNQVSGLRQRLTCWLTMLTFETRCRDLQAQLTLTLTLTLTLALTLTLSAQDAQRPSH